MNASLSTYVESHRPTGVPLRLASVVVALALLLLSTAACAAQPGDLARGASPAPHTPEPWASTHSASRGIPKSPLEDRLADLVLRLDPSLTTQRLVGAQAWADAVVSDVAGLDSATLRGYESVGVIQPWTAERFDGFESCLLLRTTPGSEVRSWSCAPAGSAPAVSVSTVRAHGAVVGPPHGSVLTFVALDGVVEVRKSMP